MQLVVGQLPENGRKKLWTIPLGSRRGKLLKRYTSEFQSDNIFLDIAKVSTSYIFSSIE